jgi:phage FluMu protein Com
MGFNRPKMEDQRRDASEKEAASRRVTDAQVLEDAERLIAAWNERQALRAPMIFSPTIGAAIRAGYWFLWVRCPACRTINAIDLRTLDRHPDAAVTRACTHKFTISALPPKADIGTQPRNVRFLPKADIMRCGRTGAIRSPRRHGRAATTARRDRLPSRPSG